MRMTQKNKKCYIYKNIKKIVFLISVVNYLSKSVLKYPQLKEKVCCNRSAARSDRHVQ